MSDVNIDIGSSFNGSGVNAAISGMDRLKASGDRYANSAQEIAQLNSQYYASQNRVNNVVTQGATAFGALKAGLAKVAVVAGSVYAAGKLVEKGWNFSYQGAQVLRMGESFKTVAKSYGVSSDSILSSMRRASRGTIADTDLMLAANRAMLLGVSTNATELGKITEVAIARGRAMGLTSAEAIDRVYTGIGRLSPKILDDLGIITNATERYKEYAKAHNMSVEAIDDFTKREIIKNAIIASSAALVEDYNDDTASSYERLGASWTNFVNRAKVGAADTFSPVNKFIADTLDSTAVRSRDLLVGDYVNEHRAELEGKFRKMGGYQNKKDYGFDYDAAAAYAQRMLLNQQFAQTAAQRLNAGNYAQAAAHYAPEQATSAQGFTANLDNVLSLSGQLTQVNQGITQSQQQVNEKFRDAQYVTALYREDIADLTAQARAGAITWQEYTQRVNELRTSFQDGSFKTREQSEAMRSLGQQADDSYQSIAMGALQANEATSQHMLDFALASGMITQEARNQGVAQDKLAQAFINNSISAEDYAKNVSALMSKISNMDGTRADTYINVWIKEHTIGGGETVPIGGMTQAQTNVTNSGSAAAVQGLGGPVQASGGGGGSNNAGQAGVFGHARGGWLYPGQWTLVGDMTGGKLSPYSELITPQGYVIDAKTTKEFFEKGIVSEDNIRSMYFGSDDIFGGVYSGVKRSTKTKRPGGRARSSPTRAGSGSSSSIVLGVGGGSSLGDTVAADLIMSQQEQVMQQSANYQDQQLATTQGAFAASSALVAQKIEEMTAAMLTELPRYIGQEVSGEFSKLS